MLLFRWHWLLGTIFLVCSLPLWYAGYRFEKRYGSLARQSQDQAGDLATAVEESVHGIRVLKAFGRGKHALQKFAAQAETLRETELRKAGAIGVIWFWLVLLPDIAFALCLAPASTSCQLGQLQVAELFAFFAMATVLRWPMESIGFLFSFTARRAHGDRPHLRGLRRGEHDRRSREPRHDRPARAASSRSRACTSGIRMPRLQRARSARRHRPRAAPGETMALVGLTGSGKTTLTTLPRACTT